MEVKEFFKDVEGASTPKEVKNILNSWLSYTESAHGMNWSPKSRTLFAQAVTIGYRFAKDDMI